MSGRDQRSIIGFFYRVEGLPEMPYRGSLSFQLVAAMTVPLASNRYCYRCPHYRCAVLPVAAARASCGRAALLAGRSIPLSRALAAPPVDPSVAPIGGLASDSEVA